jgi:hypothetical protein
MGQYAEDIIDGTCDWSGDYTYKYNFTYKGKYKDEPWEANIRKVRKELGILIKQKQQEYPKLANNHNLVNVCRRFINLKYGDSWRGRGSVINSPDQWKNLSEYINPEFDWDYYLNK